MFVNSLVCIMYMENAYIAPKLSYSIRRTYVPCTAMTCIEANFKIRHINCFNNIVYLRGS